MPPQATALVFQGNRVRCDSVCLQEKKKESINLFLAEEVDSTRLRPQERLSGRISCREDGRKQGARK